MTVRDLTREELQELKSRHYTEKLDSRGESPSYAELASIDNLITDAEIMAAYAGTNFVKADFFCNMNGGQQDDT